MAEPDGGDEGGDRGTHQNIARAAQVLAALAAASADGLRLTDVVHETALSKTVAHRCLAGLVAHGLAEFSDDSGRFYLGDQIFGWSHVASRRFELAERAQPYLQRLSAQTQDTAYLVVRRRDEAVCFGRAEGSFPIKTLTLSVGDRRPLGIGSGSLALLSFIEDAAERDRIIDKNAAAYAGYKTNGAEIRKLVATSRRNGYATIVGQVIDGMNGVGVPVRAPSGQVVATLTIAAIANRLLPPRRHEVVEILRAEVARYETEMALLLQRL